MLRRIHLHGSLKQLHPGPVEVHAETPAEAIKAVTRQLPGFRPNAVRGPQRVKVAGFESLESLIAPTDVQDFHLFPQLNGGKQGGFLQIVVGAVLIAASFIPGLNAFAPILLKLGVMMIIGGILQLFSAPKRDDKDKEEKRSHYLGAPRNTVEIGTRIPILLGRGRVGGHYLSFDIASIDTGAV